MRPVLNWPDVALLITGFFLIYCWLEARGDARRHEEEIAHLRAENHRLHWLLGAQDRRDAEVEHCRRLTVVRPPYDHEMES